MATTPLPTAPAPLLPITVAPPPDPPKKPFIRGKTIFSIVVSVLVFAFVQLSPRTMGIAYVLCGGLVLMMVSFVAWNTFRLYRVSSRCKTLGPLKPITLSIGIICNMLVIVMGCALLDSVLKVYRRASSQ